MVADISQSPSPEIQMAEKTSWRLLCSCECFHSIYEDDIKELKEIAISSTIWLVFLVKKSFIYVSRVQSPPISKLKSRDPILLRLPKVCAADLHHLYRPKFRYFLSVSFRPVLVFRFFQFVLRWDSAMTVSMAFSHPSWSGRFLGINTMGSSPTFAL